jgi:hypothetical protein
MSKKKNISLSYSFMSTPSSTCSSMLKLESLGALTAVFESTAYANISGRK